MGFGKDVDLCGVDVVGFFRQWGVSGFGFCGMGISSVSRFRETRIWDGGSALVGLRQCRDNGFSGGIE